MRSALGNIGTKIVFAVDRVDAEVMAKKLFLVSGEEIKHEVVDEVALDKTHPVFYSLQEEWEQAIQAIQNLRPRTCLVKAPQREVAKAYTITIPRYQVPEAELDRIRAALLRRSGQPGCQLREASDKRVVENLKEITEYEVLGTKRQQLTQFTFQTA